MTRKRRQLGSLKRANFSRFAPMSASIFFGKAFRLCLGAKHVSELAIYENYLVAAS